MSNPVHMRHLTNSLKERFRPLIDMTDRVKSKPEDEEKAFLSRAVTALAVKHETGWSDREAAAAVIDDYSDRGIDAVAVDLGPNGALRRLAVIENAVSGL